MLEDSRYDSGTDVLRTGETLVLYTDGIPEAMNRKLELFSDEQFQQTVLAGSTLPIDGLRDRILGDVKAFIGTHPPSDDMTLLLIRRT
jgi:sigma-B regulation protein RsbU (phosphoserine phosphatase)